MLFNTLEYGLFFAAVLIGYFSLRQSRPERAAARASYFFYGRRRPASHYRSARVDAAAADTGCRPGARLGALPNIRTPASFPPKVVRHRVDSRERAPHTRDGRALRPHQCTGAPVPLVCAGWAVAIPRFHRRNCAFAQEEGFEVRGRHGKRRRTVLRMTPINSDYHHMSPAGAIRFTADAGAPRLSPRSHEKYTHAATRAAPPVW